MRDPEASGERGANDEKMPASDGDAIGSFDMNVGTPGGSGGEGHRPDAPSMGIDVDEERERVDALLEVTIGQGASMASIYAMVESIAGAAVDREFEPVTVRPTRERIPSTDPESQQVVLVRASVERSRLDEVESQVDGLWEDRAVLQPFEQSTDEPGGGTVAGPADPFDFAGTASASVAEDSYCPDEAVGSLHDGSVTEYLGVDEVWDDEVRGEGVVVGIVDGGITAEGRRIDPEDRNHPQWPGKTVPNVTDGYPADSWGTTGRGWMWHGNMSATDVLGVAPAAELYDIRLTGRFASSLVSAVDWAIRKHEETGTPHVLNVSAGIYQRVWDPEFAENPDHPATRKVLEAVDEGIVVLFAAGNCGQGCASTKCSLRDDPETDNVGPSDSIWGVNGHERVITVGAATIDERRLGYSSQGPSALDEDGTKPDICGVSHFEGYNDVDSGTSAATPTTSGVVALLTQADPELSTAETKTVLQSTAVDIGESGLDNDTGAGIVQADAAYERVRPSSTGSYGDWTAVTGDLLYAPTVVATADGGLELFMFGYDFGLYRKSHADGAWTEGLTLISDELAGLSGPAAVRNGGTVELFAVGPERDLYRITVSDRDGAGEWERVGEGPCLFAPAAVARDDGVDVFAVRGSEGERYLYHGRFDGGRGDWERLGGVCTSGPAAVSTGPDELDVFVRGGDDAVHRMRRRDGEWGRWESVGGTVCGGVATTAGTDEIHLFVGGPGGRLQRTGFADGSRDDWETVGRPSVESPAAVARGDAVEVFAVAPNTNVLHKTRKPS
ncbi:peptidase S8 and S53 subtilisin kexin sedolisin [Halosimplex carlsbadense 2-9-1]|uniref:Peptidase S8 and S53 subtilisin kexin sedolisin n=1 Tax=Halosimplex carlsbadense 2-9-1 TaxID=797114 RepID=M0CTB0_9EURY|nr:S8 family serine peptidase [Halosimplex carlsbadense]ELZ25104.1 peptidase S8 and S53 subtilisin kexin sedolisin [Halosimplex carlsbadense 2-9-1]